MNKKLITSAVASAVALPTAAFAAIDDQGMAYVTAAEGLHGSLQMFILDKTSADDATKETDVSTNSSDLRLWVNGTADLGGGLQSTYYWEFRGNKDPNQLGLLSEAWDIGLKGAFGEVEFGRLGMTGHRLTPSASLAFKEGSQRESPSADPGNHGWRYESPVINGFQFGISGILDGNGGPEGSLDEYALAAKYTMPIGLEVGGAYESVKNGKGAQALDTETSMTDDREKSQGFRFGMRYGQDNWLLGYEYRTYDSFVPSDFGPITANVDLASGASPTVQVTIDSGEKDVDYSVHAFGVQVKLDRITMSANYSTDEVEMSIDTDGAGDIETSKYKKEREVIAVDAAYALGSRTHIAVGWLQTDASDEEILATETAGSAAEKLKESRTYVFYRVDF